MNTSYLAGLALLVSAPFAHGGLIGDNVTLTKYFPNLATPTGSISFLVTDPGVEEACSTSNCFMQPQAYSLDLGDSSIAFTQNLIGGLGLNRDPNPFNGYVFTDLNLGSPITGIAFSQTGYTGFTASDVTFTANSVSVNLQGTSAEIDASWLITLETGDVPEPHTMALLAIGLSGIAVISRIRR
jgi:hypothetical protein